MKTVEGNLIIKALEGEFDVIAHGCNCHNMMGSGIALAIATAFPQAYVADRLTTKGDINKLGTMTLTRAKKVDAKGSFDIANLYTQYDPGRDLDYTALRLCLKKLALTYPGCKIGLPKIGCGIAGGNWEVVKIIISEEMLGCDVTIVEYNPKRQTEKENDED